MKIFESLLNQMCDNTKGERNPVLEMLMKILSHPGQVNSKCYSVGNWTCFSFLNMFHLSSKRIL